MRTRTETRTEARAHPSDSSPPTVLGCVVGYVPTQLPLLIPSPGRTPQVTFRELNALNTDRDPGFYPFIYTFAGLNVAHGANPSFVERSMPSIISGVPRLAAFIDGTELNGMFVRAAEQGGGWVGYEWSNSGDTQPFLKIAYIIGVRVCAIACVTRLQRICAFALCEFAS